LRCAGSGLSFCGSGWSAGGLVVASWVDDQVAEVVDEQDGVGSGVGSANADVAEPAGDGQGDGAGFVVLVVADSVVGVGALRSVLGVALGSDW
ncbi:MAG: hypothetical protein M3042_06150, partial [Actinomycetota bacterium]|nr:hypothetical protein [Actinomycetota bacterium]